METQKNNSITDLGKLLTGEKSRSSLTGKEIYDYLKNYHVPMKGDSLFKNLVTNFFEKTCFSFFLLFKMKWLEENLWLVYSKEIQGGLSKFCVLFDGKDSNRGIFVKRAFQDVGKPEKIRQHAKAKYHNEKVTLALNFVMSNVNYDPEKQERYDKNVHVLKRIIQAVGLGAQQGLPLRCETSRAKITRIAKMAIFKLY